MGTSPRMEVCDVCFLLEGDTRQKLCWYCSRCDAWICQADLERWDRRARAAAARVVVQ